MATIVPSGDSQYIGSVQKLLNEIKKNPVGQVLVRGMTKDVYIVPIHYGKRRDDPKKLEDPKSCRAFADADDHLAATPKLKLETDPSSTSRDRFFTCETDEEARFNTHSSKRIPTGTGSGGKVFFTPGNAAYGCFTGAGWDSPELILFHELVHCLRNAHGLSHCVPTKKPDYTNEEEFLAIHIANVYLRAKSPKASLRHGHGPGQALWPPLDTSKGFVDDRENYGILSQHFGWVTFGELAALKGISFNPFKEFADRKKADADKKKQKKPAEAKPRK